MPEQHPSGTIGRRGFLAAAAAGATCAVPMLVGLPRKLSASGGGFALVEPETPDQALARLYEGQTRFAEGRVTSPNRNLARVREVAPKQKPFAAFLGCADSRVPIEILFDQGFGDVFVTRVAGNVADPAIIGSLEFGTQILGAKVIYVLGHSGCGAVAAAMSGGAVPGQISTLYQHLIPATRGANGNLDAAIKRNVELQADLLRSASPVIADLVKAGKLKIAGGIYDLATGRVTPVSV